MARQVSNFMIGLFVSLGVIIGVTVIVWVGASRYFEKGKLYVSYFDESVQGLQRDSAVKYRGVNVGRIVSIDVAPDHNLIEVIMKISLSGDLEKNTVAQLKAVGLTGIVFVELDRRDPETSVIVPRITFKSTYPIIPSISSDVEQILTGIDTVLARLNQIDFQGISDQIKKTARSADQSLAALDSVANKVSVLDFQGISDQVKTTVRSADNLLFGDRMSRIMSNLESSSMAFDKSMKQLDKIIAEIPLERRLKEATQTLTDVRALVADLKKEIIDKIDMADLQGISDQIKRTAKSADDILAGDRMNRIMSNLESSSMAFDKSMKQLDKIIAEASLQGIFAEAKQSLVDIRRLLATTHEQIEALKLADIAVKANKAMDSLTRSTWESALNIQEATEKLRSASESLALLVERLEANPSDLIFSR